jgi:membrane protease YdiL (CAAX protease family)
MYIIDSSNAKEHSYPVYGRQFKSYRWYKPLLAGILFAVLFLLAGMALILIAARGSGVGLNGAVGSTPSNIFSGSYDDMDLANAWQSVVNLGSIAVMIPALWLTTKIVRDRPFTSYSSSRGGWSHRTFWRTMPVAFLCISLPIIVWELFHEHHIDDFRMRFTLASFLVLTVLGPLQCIAEEYVFRGLMMQTLGSWFRLPVIAVVLQSCLFALMHPYDIYGKIGIFASGLVFALSAWIGRGIEVSAAYHICNNMTIFYLQGMNLAAISSKSDMEALIFEIITGAVFVIAIFIISRKTDWYSSVKKDDVAAWNEKYDAKIARKEEKIARKEAKIAAKYAPIGEHGESTGGKHFKQQ